VDESNPKIKYELVFGERRLKACIKVGVPFKAEIAVISDAEFIQLHSTENRFRPQLSIVESALQFKSWLVQRRNAEGGMVSVAELADEIGYSQAHFFRLQAIGKIDEEVLFGIPSVESLTGKETDMLCKGWNNADQRKLIISRLGELAINQLKGKAAVEHLCRMNVKNEAGNSNKVSIKLPQALSNRDSLVAKLKELGAEFGIDIVVK
jgi:ParB/RepB/Spo0J family partition protein